MPAKAAQPASHDNVFHTVLGLLDVDTAVRNAALDLSATCRG
jgi:lipid A ethanolaminephosphotransferase